MADILSMVNGVIGMGERGRQAGTAQRVNRLAGQAFGAAPDQRAPIMQQLVATDPDAGLALQDRFQKQDDQRGARLAGAAKYLLNAWEAKGPDGQRNEAAIQGAYRVVRPEFEALANGRPLPDTVDDTILPMLHQVIAQHEGAGAGDEMKSLRIGANGNYWAIRGGQFVDTGVRADPRTQLRDQPGIAPGIVDLRTGAVTPLADGGQPAPMAPQTTPQPSGGDPFASLQASVPGLRITSRTRTPEENARAGGVANSFHLTGQAIDIGTPSPDQRRMVDQWAARNNYEVIDNYQDGHVHLEPRGRPPAQPTQASAAAPRPAVSQAEAQRLEIARQANARAEEANQRAAEAARLAQRGNAPAGFRFKADGTLEPIPGGPKPAGSAATEGERKAAVLLQRLNGSLTQLEAAVKANPDADSPSVAAEMGRVIPFVGEAAANAINSPERQRVEAAQLDILDAALTLGTGAAYTREQLEGYRRSFFPQIADSDATIRDKAARLQNVIQAARIAAGRAAPATGGAPARPQSQADYDALPSGAMFVDPDDGQTYRKP